MRTMLRYQVPNVLFLHNCNYNYCYNYVSCEYDRLGGRLNLASFVILAEPIVDYGHADGLKYKSRRVSYIYTRCYSSIWKMDRGTHVFF